MAAMVAVLVAFWVLASLLLIGLFERFRALVARSSTADFSPESWPEAVVILSLRGSDERLRETLDGLAVQDYPRYQLHIVVDHPTDPANRIVQAWRRRHPAVAITVQYLKSPPRRCTLKSGAIRQVLRSLSSPPGAVVIVDGDADPYPKWLRDAVRPLADPGIGAVTGNRWYWPRRGNIASWSRFVFTALSLPTMEREGYAWGGTLALRGDLACGLFLHLLAVRPTEEQAAFETVRGAQLRLAFNPQLVQWNPESIELRDLTPFLFRQLMMARFYYPTWNQLLWGAITAGAAAITSIGLFIAAARQQNLFWTAPAGAGVGLCLALAVELALVHGTLQQHVFNRQRRQLPVLRAGEFLALTASLPVTLAAFAAAIVRVQFAKQAVWRRIRYRFYKTGIEREAYRPFIAGDAPQPQRRPAVARSRHAARAEA